LEQKVVVASSDKFVKSNHQKQKWAFRKPFAIILGRMGKQMHRLNSVVFFLTILLTFSWGKVFAGCGINIDPANPTGFPTAESLSGMDWVRVEFKDCTSDNSVGSALDDSISTYKTIIDNYASENIKTLLIIDYMSYPAARSDIGGWTERVERIVEGLGTSGIVYQIWNEPDINQGGNMSATEYASLLSPAATAIKAEGGTVITAGLASGHPSWLSDLKNEMKLRSTWTNVDAVAVHPYGKEVTCGGTTLGHTGDLIDFLNAMESVGGKNLWISEIGYGSTNENLQSDYLKCFFDEASSEVENIIWFAWSDGMVPPFGIVRADQSPKASYGALARKCGMGSVIETYHSITPNTQSGIGCGAGGPSGNIWIGDGWKNGITEMPRTIIGKITSSKVERDAITGSTETSKPVEGATICVYQGAGGDKLPYYIPNFEVSGVTDENGRFVIKSFLRYRAPDTGTGVASYKRKYNFMAVFCGNDKIAQIVQVDMQALQKKSLPAKYANLFPNFNPLINLEVLSPIELTILCPSNSPGTGFPEDIPADAYELGKTYPADPNEVLIGWDFAARHHVTGEVDGKCPQFLPYTDRRTETQLACRGVSPAQINPWSEGITTKFDLLITEGDEQYRGKNFGTVPEIDISTYKYEGKAATQNFADSRILEILDVQHLLTGGLLTGPKKLPQNLDENGRFESNYACKQLKQSNMSYNTEGPINVQKSHGLLNLLSGPYSKDKKKMYDDIIAKFEYDSEGNLTGGAPAMRICTIQENNSPTGIPEGTEIFFHQIQPYEYMVDIENWCEPDPTNLGSDGCPYLLDNRYFNMGYITRTFLNDEGSQNYITDGVSNDSYDPKNESDRRDVWAIASLGDNDDPFNDKSNGGDCEGPACGAVAKTKITSTGAQGLSSELATMALTEPIEVGGDIDQSAISVLGPFAGFKTMEDHALNAYSTKGHKLLIGEHKCLLSQLDGHAMYPIRIGPVPLVAEDQEGVPGSYEAAFDYQDVIEDDDGNIVEQGPNEFRGIKHQTFWDELKSFWDRFSIFWVGQTDKDACKKAGKTGRKNCDPDVDGESCTCECQLNKTTGACASPLVLICTMDDSEPDTWEENRSCDGDMNEGIKSEFKGNVGYSINMDSSFDKVQQTLETFMLPEGAGRSLNDMETLCFTDAQGSAELTQNQQSGYGAITTCGTKSPSDMVDKLRELVRMPTAIYND